MSIAKSHLDPSEILARLLASERITMIKSNVPTASFDIKNRVMYLPNWKDMSIEEEIMLVLHEMSHALFTTEAEYTEVFNKYKHLKGYCNVIEDARVEIMMKERYPGSRRQFLQGYVSLHKRDFFGVAKTNWEELLPIDKLNLYYKVGALHPVPLTQDEQDFADRMMNVKTIPEVIALAEEIWNYSKQQMTDQHQDIGNGSPSKQKPSPSEEDNQEQKFTSFDDAEGEEEGEDSVDVGTEGEEEADENVDGNVGGSEVSDEDMEKLESKTDKNYYSNLEENADTDTIIQYMQPVPTHPKAFEDAIVSYKTILGDILPTLNIKPGAQDSNGYYIHDVPFKIKKQLVTKFRKQNTPFISYMVKEFEMRKAATAYKRAHIAKTGQLDTRKLFAYKIKDELFKQTQRFQTEKNHGMVFLLDWSGSMADNLHETLQQCISLASFCHRLQIPFQVLAFSDYYTPKGQLTARSKFSEFVPQNATNKDGFKIDRFTLLEFFSHKMSVTEFNNMVDVMLSKFYKKPCFANYGLGGTPLNEAMLYMVDYVGKFKNENAVEKMSFVLLSDGEGGRLQSIMPPPVTGNGKILPCKTYLNDRKTGKQYEFDLTNAVSQIELFNKIIKDRYNTKIIKFYLADCQGYASNGTYANAYSAAARFLASMDRKAFGYSHSRQTDEKVSSIANQIKSNTFGVVTNKCGYDEAYVIDANTKIIDLEDYMDSYRNSDAYDGLQSEDVSIAAKAFTDGLNSSKKSRVLLGRFIEQIA